MHEVPRLEKQGLSVSSNNDDLQKPIRTTDPWKKGWSSKFQTKILCWEMMELETNDILLSV